MCRPQTKERRYLIHVNISPLFASLSISTIGLCFPARKEREREEHSLALGEHENGVIWASIWRSYFEKEAAFLREREGIGQVNCIELVANQSNLGKI